MRDPDCVDRARSRDENNKSQAAIRAGGVDRPYHSSSAPTRARRWIDPKYEILVSEAAELIRYFGSLDGCVMSSGRTHSSNCAPLTKPSFTAASRRLMSS